MWGAPVERRVGSVSRAPNRVTIGLGASSDAASVAKTSTDGGRLTNLTRVAC